MDGSNLSIIVPISHRAEERTISSLMDVYQSIQNVELIFVTYAARLARQMMNNVIWVADDTWQEVYEAHAIGVRYSSREVLLFMDADQSLTAASIQKFLQPILQGNADAVLNDMDYEYHKKRPPTPSKIFPQLTNSFIRRSDLNIDTILFLPYALTKQTVELIKAETLVNPVHTHVELIQRGCKIDHHLPIRNVFKLQDHESMNSEKIIDYHLRTYAECFDDFRRCGFSDGGRRLDLLRCLLKGKETSPALITSNRYHHPYSRLSIIIPVQNEEKRIGDILEECKKLHPLEIIVVVNQSSDRTASIACEAGAVIIEYKEKLGLDTGRAAGAYFASGDICLFIDGDFVIPAIDLLPFVEAIEQGADVALNDQNLYLDNTRPLHLVTACKYAINLACRRTDLGIGSTVAVPHAYSRRCMETIGLESLANPALSYAKSLLSGFVVKNVHHINVNKMNRFRPAAHYPIQKGELPPTTSVIVGDHIEALTYLGKEGHLLAKGEKNDDV